MSHVAPVQALEPCRVRLSPPIHPRHHDRRDRERQCNGENMAEVDMVMNVTVILLVLCWRFDGSYHDGPDVDRQFVKSAQKLRRQS